MRTICLIISGTGGGNMQKAVLGFVMMVGLLLGWQQVSVAASPTVNKAQYQTLSKPGTKVQLPDGGYFVYGFEKPPKVATCIMKVEIFTKNGKKDTTYTVKGDVDMPSMRGVHSRGDKDFALSNKGVYLLPVPLVMLGDWEFRFTFAKKNQTVLRGAYLFDL
jgi:hypothetical protein